MADRNARIVYSTGTGRICPGCGWPERDCKCSQRAAPESVPTRIVAKLRLEKKGRGGKRVTVVYDLPNTGGSVADGAIELQGDLRDRVREVLTKKGWLVKG
jgi:translation initiation factor 1